MLAALHRVPVAAGDAILVPAGTLHAIGGGILLLELQEPTDLSVLVEWKRFGVDSGPEHLELGWETALQSLDREPIDPAALTAATSGLLPQGGRPVLPRRDGQGRRHARPELLDPARDGGRGHARRCGGAARDHGADPVRGRRDHRRRRRRGDPLPPARAKEKRSGDRRPAARSPQDRQVVRARAGADAERTSRSTRARSSRWSATTAPASRRSSRRWWASTRPTAARSSSRGARRHHDAAAGARDRDRDRLPGPRAGGRDRPRREHVPRPRDPPRRPARQARLPRQGGDAPAQR